MISKNKKIALCALLTALLLAIMLFTLLPSYFITPIKKYIHIKTGHKLAYFTLTALLVFIFRVTTKYTSCFIYCISLLLATGFGALLEVGQRFTLTREGNIKDVVINFMGGVIAICVCFVCELLYTGIKHLKILYKNRRIRT